MLKHTYLSKRPVAQSIPFSYGGKSVADRAAKLQITPIEFYRRDNIVKKLFDECLVRVGFEYEPKDTKMKEEYGVCKIKTVFRDYFDFSLTDTWPDDDIPLIITASSIKGNCLICASSGWFDHRSIRT